MKAAVLFFRIRQLIAKCCILVAMKHLFALTTLLFFCLFLVACSTPIAVTTTEEEQQIPSTEVVAETPSVPPTREILTFEAFDEYPLTGRLTLPAGDRPVDKLVIYVNGSGPNTYENKRESNGLAFSYFDFFADEFSDLGVAFFSYNTRGVSIGEEPPLFQEIDDTAYQSYIPHNEVKDVATMIAGLQDHPRLQNAKIILLGWSAGTIISPLTVLTTDARVDVLLLAGYTNTTMRDALDWQQTGGSSMVFYRQYFDYDGDRKISPQEFGEDRYQVAAMFGITFQDLDVDQSGYLDEQDFAILLAPSKEALYAAIDRHDDQRLAQNYGIQLTSAWFDDYATLAPNSETLLLVDIPIYIFHGVNDANVPVEQVHAIEESFKEKGKTNLTVSVFPDHDHDLNFAETVVYETIPAGLQAIFDCVGVL